MLVLWSGLPAAQAGTSHRMANRTRRSEGAKPCRSTGQPGSYGGFFWQQRGKKPADSSPSQQTWRQKFKQAVYKWCGKICLTKTGVTNHERRIHEISSQKKMFKCDKCDKNFLGKSNLTTHKKVCTGLVARNENKKKCDKCLKEVSASNFARHRKKCAPEENRGQNTTTAKPKVPCDRCGAQISSNNLARHKRLICL